MQGALLNPDEERRRGADRRSGVDRRVRSRREGDRRDTAVPGALPLSQLLPYGPLSERDAGQRAAAIEAHRALLSAPLGRDVGLPVAALDYLLHVSRDLVAPTIVEHDVLRGLEHRSVTDPLTGLFNRYHLESTLTRELARSLRYRRRLTLLLIDVDRLKAVNDRHGHQAGDRVLIRVAEAIRHSLRGSDTASRYGGDEFAVILPDTGARAGRLVAERVCGEIAAGAAGEGTVSIGVAEIPVAAREGSEAALFVAADQALYLAKRRGGNGVAVSSPPEGATP